MNIVFMGNNYVGWQIFKRLVEMGESIQGLVLHPDDKATYKDRFIETSKDLSCFVWDAPVLREPDYVKKLQDLKPDLILSVLFGYILKKDILQIPTKGCINIHNGYLPYNKGVNANIWSIVDKTPAGATIHYMEEGIDTGDIIERREVPVLYTDTGKSLYHKIEASCISLFEETWGSIKDGTAPRIPQNPEEGTFHCRADLKNLDRIDPEKLYKGETLINILRSRTFSPFQGTYVMHEGKKYFLKLSIEEAEDE